MKILQNCVLFILVAVLIYVGFFPIPYDFAVAFFPIVFALLFIGSIYRNKWLY